MKKKNLTLIIIIILTIILIATIMWIYSKRIEKIENRIKTSPVAASSKSHT